MFQVLIKNYFLEVHEMSEAQFNLIDVSVNSIEVGLNIFQRKQTSQLFIELPKAMPLVLP